MFVEAACAPLKLSNVGEEWWRVFDSSQQPERFQEHDCQLYDRAVFLVIPADLVRVVTVVLRTFGRGYSPLQLYLLLLNLFPIHGPKMFPWMYLRHKGSKSGRKAGSSDMSRKHLTSLKCFLSDITFNPNCVPASFTCSTSQAFNFFFFLQKWNFWFAKQITRESQAPLSCIQKLILQPSDGCAKECLINVHENESNI